MCGGTQHQSRLRRRRYGLSPRVRGNPGPDCVTYRAGRSIPACAGEPAVYVNVPRREEVYPRVCGGTDNVGYVGHYDGGLSPRVRGNPPTRYWWICPGGSIPACAGEPQTSDHWAAWPKVYPRVCGGTPGQATTTTRPDGLSPRVRGNLEKSITPPAGIRSIPACAGEPTCQRIVAWRRGVYPRVCGGTAVSLSGRRQS